MRKVLVCVALCLAMICPSAAFSQEKEKSGGWTGNANIFTGKKYLVSDNWEPVDQPIEAGLLLDFRPKRWWVSMAFDFLYALDRDEIDVIDLGIGRYTVDVESRIMEFNTGVRKVWESPRYVRPFIGGGLAIVNARMKARAMGGEGADE
jgi:hypothetical protein